MNILVSCAEKVFPASLDPGDSVAVYAVPQAYSKDGLYLARWAAGEFEPVPACDGAGLLLKLRLESVQDNGVTLREIHKAEGVEYAEN